MFSRFENYAPNMWNEVELEKAFAEFGPCIYMSTRQFCEHSPQIHSCVKSEINSYREEPDFVAKFKCSCVENDFTYNMHKVRQHTP